jgi:hypothetical protein
LVLLFNECPLTISLKVLNSFLSPDLTFGKGAIQNFDYANCSSGGQPPIHLNSLTFKPPSKLGEYTE